MSKVGVFLGKILHGRKSMARSRTRAILVGSGNEARDLFRQVNDASHFRLAFAHYCDTKTLSGSQVVSWVQEFVKSGSAKVVVLDVHDVQTLSILPELYALSFHGVQYIDQQIIIEEINESVSLSHVSYAWLVEHISQYGHAGYDRAKRILDLVIAIPLFVVSIPLYIPIMLAVGRDGGPMFFVQEYVGKNNKQIYLAKFRTANASMVKLGKFVHRTHLDELPQLFSVIVGDLSLIGPRPLVPALVAAYGESIPYYRVRHFIAPGLLGWAEVHKEKSSEATDEAQDKLAYDLYYVQHRSLWLDLKIALRTVRTLLSRDGA